MAAAEEGLAVLAAAEDLGRGASCLGAVVQTESAKKGGNVYFKGVKIFHVNVEKKIEGRIADCKQM